MALKSKQLTPSQNLAGTFRRQTDEIDNYERFLGAVKGASKNVSAEAIVKGTYHAERMKWRTFTDNLRNKMTTKWEMGKFNEMN